MLDTNLSYQLMTFMSSLACGVLTGFVYIFFKCIRIMFSKSRLVTIVCDIVFMTVFTLVTFVFCVGYCDGYVRYYVLIGEFTGLIIFVLTIGRFVCFVFKHTVSIIRKFVLLLQKNIKQIAKKLLKASTNMLYNIKNKSNIHMDLSKGE